MSVKPRLKQKEIFIVCSFCSILSVGSVALYIWYKHSRKPVTEEGEPTVLLVTGNKYKLMEFKSFLSADVVKYVKNEDIVLDELQELSPNKIVKQKCFDALKALLHRTDGHYDIDKTLVIVDDISLFLNEYENELPGPLIKWFIPKINKNKTSCKHILKMLKHTSNRKATAMCLYACVDLRCVHGDDTNAILRQINVFEGVCHGTIAEKEETEDGLGFNTVFVPNGHNVTMSQLTTKQKFDCSHRANAVKKLNLYLTQWIKDKKS